MTKEQALEKLQNHLIWVEERHNNGTLDNNSYKTMTAWLNEEIFKLKIKLKNNNHGSI